MGKPSGLSILIEGRVGVSTARALAAAALPLAAGGWLIAAFHTLQYAGVIPPALEPCGAGPSCTSGDMTILGGVPLPVLSLLAFTIIAALLALVSRRHDA